MSRYRIHGTFTTRSPLSHIGETISATSYLVQERILQEDGSTEDVFTYSGNAWRGQLRDLAAGYMLDKLGAPRVSLETFHLLFSGGRIGGAQTVDVEQARRMRAAVPVVALWGGGVGNQILAGKMRVGNAYPICREAARILPRALRTEAERTSYAAYTFTKEHSRRDDAKIDTLRRHLAAPESALLPGLVDAPQPKGKRKDVEPSAPDQMRMGMELLCAGARLATWIVLEHVSDVELGALVSALHSFSASPFIGGKSAIGYGLVNLDYAITDLDTGEVQPFLTVKDDTVLLAAPAAEAKAAYDQHLRSLYDDLLTSQAAPIRQFLGAA